MRTGFIGILFCTILLASCGASRKSVSNAAGSSPDARKAVDHYLSGALYDFQDQYREALTEYRKALLLDSTSAEILKAIGRDYYRVEQFGYAIQYLTRAHTHNASDKETLYLLAESYFNINDADNAIVYYEKLNALDPFNTSVHGNLVFLYTRTGKIDTLVAFRERLVELFEYESEAVYQLVVLYIQLNRLGKASNLIQILLDKAPNEPRNWAFYGNILELQKDTTAAVTAYRKALDLDTSNEKAINQLYYLHRQQQDWSGLTETFEDVVRRDSTNFRARLILAEGYFYQDRYPEVRRLLNPLLKQEAYKEQAWEFLAVLYFQAEDYENCIALLEDALVELPDNKRMLFIYGSALQQDDRDQEALAPLKRAYELDPQDYNSIVTLSLSYDNLGMYSSLDSLYTMAMASFPDDALLLNNFSYSLSERGLQLRRALEMAQRAVELEPDNGAYLDTIGWIHYKLGNYQIALQYIERAIAYREESAVVIEHLGDVHFKLGNLDQAKQFWQQALEKDPSNAALKNKLEQE